MQRYMENKVLKCRQICLDVVNMSIELNLISKIHLPNTHTNIDLFKY